jgi:hypothetical protein
MLTAVILSLYLSELKWTGLSDLMWTVVSVMGLVLVITPSVKRRGSSYHSRIVIMAAVPFIIYSVIAAIHMIEPFDVTHYRLATLIVQTFAVMMCGYMLMINIDVNTETTLSKRWLLVFSITFSCMFTTVYALALFFPMVEMGYLMYDEDYIGIIGRGELSRSNTYQMLPAIVTSFASIAYALVIRSCLRSVPKEDITKYHGGGPDEL